MANEKNLVSLADRTTSEQREIAKAGGIASGEARRKRKNLKEELEIMLETGDTQERVAAALIQKALDGNVRAFEVIRDCVDGKPATTIMTQEVDPAIIAEVEALVLSCCEE